MNLEVDLLGVVLPEDAYLREMAERTGDWRMAGRVADILASGEFYGHPPQSRRRTKAQMEELKAVAIALALQLQPVTVRQMFYQLVSRGLVRKTEREYQGVARLLLELRREEYLDYRMIADNTRWMQKPPSYNSLEQALEDWLSSYRLNLWRDQKDCVEIWCEKDALAGVLYAVTSRWDVPLMVTRGYPSESFLYEAALDIRERGKPAYLYYFGDYDPSGVDIARSTEERLRKFVGDAVPLHFERVAVTEEQIQAWGLPTRPTKPRDTRAKRFRGESVEVDAIPPDRLRELTEACILRHIDPSALKRLQVEEEAHRETLERIRKLLRGESFGGLLP